MQISLQATGWLRFDDSVRLEVESNICGETGITSDCFSSAQHIVYCHIERTYLDAFLQSELCMKYLSDLVSSVHLAADSVVVPQTPSESGSEKSSSLDRSESLSSRNTLLATDTRYVCVFFLVALNT